MNQNMWSHPATMANFQLLATRGVVFVGPDMGSQACGDFGWGRMSEPSTIINALRLHAVSGLLHGRHVVISAGPTEEAIDPVRFVSNRSSGKMGYALAEAALMAGALVTLVSGPVRLSAPAGIHRVSVRTALEMRAAVLEQLTPGSVFIATAAVADFRACETVSQKIKKTEDSGNLIVAFEKNPDIVQDVVHAKLADFVVCFAAETEFMLEHARDKFKRKQVDMLVANRVGAGLGFDVDENEVVIITKDGEETLPLQHKVRIAGNLIAMIAAKLHNTTF
jgi:phosphopantothenoylcysteine decarboxylase/phosphopantothenate--cysteine ligase